MFHVYQHVNARAVLEELVIFFGCGRLRPKGPNSNVWTYAVDSLRDLERAIVPFFERYPLVVKQPDFRRFATIVEAMRGREHLTPSGFDQVVRVAYAMTRQASSDHVRSKRSLRDPQRLHAGRVWRQRQPRAT